MNSEVLIIGGGVIGLSIARELHLNGVQRIAILDRGRLASEASWAAAGMLAPDVETGSVEEFYRFSKHSLELFPELSRSLLDETGIDIELDRSGTLCIAFNKSDAEALEEKHAITKTKAEVEMLDPRSVLALEPVLSPEVVSGLLFPNDWQVDNRKFLSALRRSAALAGTRIIENSEAAEVLTSEGVALGVRTRGGDLKARVIVLATGAWTSLIKIGEDTTPIDVKPIRGQMISVQTADHILQRVVYSPRGYLVPRADGRILVGATVEDVGFDKRVTQVAIESLWAAAIEIVPSLKDLSISEAWSGLRPMASDELPIVGRVPGYENLFVATAHYRNGILLAPLTAKVIAEEIVSGQLSDDWNFMSYERVQASSAVASVVGE